MLIIIDSHQFMRAAFNDQHLVNSFPPFSTALVRVRHWRPVLGPPLVSFDTQALSTLDLLGTILGAEDWYIRQAPSLWELTSPKGDWQADKCSAVGERNGG